MSTKYKHSHEVPTAVLAKRLDELSDAVGKRGEERDRELTRRIPAELDRDADLVLSEAAQRLLKMEAEVAKLKRQVCEISGEADWAEHVAETSREELEEVGEENHELKRERDALVNRVDFLNQQNSAQQEQNDALAAHVEWLDGLRRNVIEAIHDDRFEDLDISFYRDDQQPPKPTTSLARRDAEMRIEGALAIRHLTSGDDWEDDDLRAVIDDYVAGLRRQAKEDA